MTQTVASPPLNDNDALARFWFYEVGLNVTPQPTKTRPPPEGRDGKYWTSWHEWKDKPIPIETFEQWIKEGKFSNTEGLGIIPGKIWRGKHSGK